MSNSSGEMIFDARMDASDFKKDANSLGSIVKGLGVFEVIKKGMNMVVQSIDAAASRVDTLNRFPKVMEQMGYGADNAEVSIGKLSDGIDGLPTTLDEIVGSTQRLAIATGDLDKGTDTALALNNALLASGASMEAASRGSEQYIQALSRNKIEMQEWKVLQETMPYALQKTAEAFGYTGTTAMPEFYDALQSGEITMTQFNDMLISLNGGVGGFAEVAQTASGGIATSWQNIQTAVTKGTANVIQAIDEGLESVGGIAGVLDGVKNAVNAAFTVIANGAKFVVKNFVPLTAGVIAFGVAWKGIKLAGYISQLGSVSKALTAMLPKVIASAAAKTKETAAVMASGAAYVKDTIVRIANTVATKAASVATLAANGGLAVQAALVNAAVAAKIKDTAATVAHAIAEKAKSIATAAGNLITGIATGAIGLHTVATVAQTVATTAATVATGLLSAALTLLSGPVGWIIAGVAALVGGLIALFSWLNSSSEAYKEQKKEIEELSKAHDEYTAQLEEDKNAADQAIAKTRAQASANNDLVGNLRNLMAANDAAGSNNEAIAQTIDQLNESVEGLGLTYDETTGQIGDSIDAVEAYVRAQGEIATITAQEEEYNRLLGEQLDIQAKINVEKERQELLAQQLADELITQNEYNDLMEKSADLVEEYSETQEALALDVEAAHDAIDTAAKTTAQNQINAYEAINGARTSDGKNLKQLAKLYGTTTDQILADMDAQGISMQEWADNNAALFTEDSMNLQQVAAKWGMTTDQVTAYMNEWGMSLDEFNADMADTHTSAGLNLDQLAAKWGTTTEEIKNQMAMQGISMQEWSDNQDARTQDVINSFKEIPAKYEMSADEMIDVLQANAERYAAWTENMATLSETMSAEAIAELQKLGPEANSAIEEMIADPAKAAEFEASVAAVMSAGANGATVGASDPQFAEAGAEAGANVGEGMEGSEEATAAATQMVENVAAAAAAAVESADFSSIGQAIGTKIADGIKNADMSGISTGLTTAVQTGSNSVNATISTMTSQVQTKLNTFSTAAQNTIILMMTNITSAINVRVANVNAAAQNIVNGVISRFNSMATRATNIGAQVISGMISGLNANAPALYAKADSIAAEVIRRLEAAFDIHSPSRVTENLFSMVAQGMIVGLDDEETALFKKVDEMADGVLERLRIVPEGIAAKFTKDMAVAINANQGAIAAAPAVATAADAPLGVVYNFYTEQTINSPRHTSASENSRELDAMLRRARYQIK